jgi:hypothetical protein
MIKNRILIFQMVILWIKMEGTSKMDPLFNNYKHYKLLLNFQNCQILLEHIMINW